MFRNIVKSLIPKKLFASIEPIGHLLESILWQTLAGFPARNMKVIGVTGTDGKTTTSTLIYSMLNDAGIKTGLMTTIGYGTPENWHENFMHMTTLPTKAMLGRIKELRDEGIEWLVLETTSHALAQNRIWGIPYSVAVLTNVTHEHLDYHGTFERYRNAKRRLFKLAAANDRSFSNIRGIINSDDPSAEYFLAEAGTKTLTYGIDHGEIRAKSIKLSGRGSKYKLVTKDKSEVDVAVNLPGEFNVYNSLAAAAVGLSLNLGLEQISHGISSLSSVEGRMTSIEAGQDYSVIVDFAHTPDSFEKILSSIVKLTDNRLIVVFGSAGRRDEAKRAKQGASAGKWADIVIITEEDDRDVDGTLIMEQIGQGASSQGKILDEDMFLISNRVEAIEYAMSLAKSGDTVLLLGKGHEKTIERADSEHPWDESAVARDAILKALQASS